MGFLGNEITPHIRFYGLVSPSALFMKTLGFTTVARQFFSEKGEG